MIKLNIFEKIFQIMEEYENKKKTVINNYHHKNINKDINENINKENNIFENDFFKFIFNNIKISKKEIDNLEIKKDNQKSDDNYNENYINNNIFNNSLTNINDYPSKYNNNNNKNNNDNYNSNNDNYNSNNDNSLIIKEYIKKLYKKLLLLCHPDKNGDKELFIKCQEYYNNNLLIGLLYIGYKIKINLPLLNKVIIDHIFIEIRIIQEKIKNNEV
jgi:hypothetical protein